MASKKTESNPAVPNFRGSYSPEIPGPQREEFRRYLEKTGVLDAISLSFAHLYIEDKRVSNPIDYFINRLVDGVPSKIEMESIRAEKETLEKEVADLKLANEILNEKVNEEDERQKLKSKQTMKESDYKTETHGED